MTDLDTYVTPNETGILRLFSLETDMPEAADLAAALRDQRDDAGTLLARALGASDIDPYWVALIETRDLGSLGLEGYLIEGHDVPPEALAAARPMLDAVRGTVVAVPSRAFGGLAQELDPVPWLVPLTSFDTRRDPVPVAPMAPAEVDPIPPRPQPEPPRPAAPAGPGGLSPKLMLMILAAAAIVVALVALNG